MLARHQAPTGRQRNGTYLQRIGAQLAGDGVDVTLRTARCEAAAREIVDGSASAAAAAYRVHPSRAGDGRHGSAWARCARPGRTWSSTERAAVPGAGLRQPGRRAGPPATATSGRSAGRVLSRIGWFVESRACRRDCTGATSTSRCRCRRCAISPALGVDSDRVAVVRQPGLDERHRRRDDARSTRVWWCSRSLSTNRSRTRWTPWHNCADGARPCPHDVVGGGWWQGRLLQHAQRLGIAEAVTFHGHVDDDANTLWCNAPGFVTPPAREGWALAVVEAAQHGVPTIGYRSSGG